MLLSELAREKSSNVGHIPRLRGLSSQTRTNLLPYIVEKRIATGEKLINQGDAARFFFLIKSGFFKWERSNSWGNLTILDIHGPCEAPGELAIRLGSPYPASGIALTPATLIGFPRQIYLDLLKSDAGFSSTTSFCLASRAHSLLGRIAEDAEPDIEHRLAGFILRLVFKFGGKQKDGTWTVPFYISRKDLSAAVTCRIETTIRTMRKWDLSHEVNISENLIRVSDGFVSRIKAIQESESLYFGSECTNCVSQT